MKTRFALAACVALAMPYAAHAIDVESPYVNKGVVELDLKNRLDFDHRRGENGYREHLFGIGYGITDRWGVEFDGELSANPDKTYSYKTTKLETTLLFTSKGQYWVDAGVEFSYEFAHKDTLHDLLGGSLLLAKNEGPWGVRANIGLTHEVGRHAETETAATLKWQGKYTLDEHYAPGLEYYGEFGDVNNMPGFHSQGHHLGPALLGQLAPGISYDAGWLFGISKGAEDHILKVNLSYEFSL